MEAVMDVPEAPVAEAEKPDQIWQWNTWVHVGPGAEICEHIKRDGEGRAISVECPLESPETPPERRHFHAWCRLPNQFAYRDIAEKAQAGRARKMRQLRDSESDASLILEDSLEALRDDREALIDEINFSKFNDREEVERGLREEEEFEHIDQDREELARLLITPEDERDEDAMGTLERHVGSFDGQIADRVQKLRERRAESLRGLGIDEVLAQVRKLRVDRASLAEYLHISNYWVWYVGTMKSAGSDQRKFENINKLTSAPAEVVNALQIAFTELEASLSPVGPAKNS